MKKIVLTSPKFSGSITFGYSDTGQLLFYHNQTDLDHAKNEWLLPNLPIIEIHLLSLKAKLQGTLTEVPEDTSFEAFWEVYNRKINRKRSEPLYEKLSAGDRLLAITRAKPYQKFRAGKGQEIADPEKYLRDRFFDTNWSTMK
ncbi:hypothetical protein [Mucilaginibacter psychrotolerans]|uniref:Uncharacterized protein n=1 Tax=Mucilaginibacter psychrotolerans TaxID=1524096 RepID=A0A4Y8S9M9_9SPHI|nr:hypothetical protein [Mucilaginibacter psychrotolerans]TFF35227.1 hypothetical protein E2R66_19890 [Mucilaginibacter psychrotolerans]